MDDREGKVSHAPHGAHCPFPVGGALHHSGCNQLDVSPLPRPSTSSSTNTPRERERESNQSFTHQWTRERVVHHQHRLRRRLVQQILWQRRLQGIVLERQHLNRAVALRNGRVELIERKISASIPIPMQSSTQSSIQSNHELE